MPPRPLVVKVGGSLADWPDLGPHLRRWLDRHALAETVLVPGGGPAADVVRNLDRTHQFGAEAAHWLALRAMTLMAEFLDELLRDAGVTNTELSDGADLAAAWGRGRLPVVDAFAFCTADEARPGALPHTWVVTSDSVAARVAVVVGAAEVVLLKSAAPPGDDVADWVAAGYVDEWLPRVLGGTAVGVRAVDLRGWGP
ncbi:MAG TPA: hypothetical protein VGF55_13150 [Gemmataceae bacterium]|jgi:aspartokinase-like uncharacterized kinase